MLFLWVHYLGSRGEGSSIWKETVPTWNCHDVFHSMGQGASVRVCELVIFTIIHSETGKVPRAWLLSSLGLDLDHYSIYHLISMSSPSDSWTSVPI